MTLNDLMVRYGRYVEFFRRKRTGFEASTTG